MNGFLQKLQAFFYGRNGYDKIVKWTFILAIVVLLINTFLMTWPLRILYYALVAYAVFRILSKNVYQRQKENQIFIQKTSGISKWFRFLKLRFSERKTHRYVKCPNCKTWSRVPKGRGKVEVSCRSCGTRYIKKV